MFDSIPLTLAQEDAPPTTGAPTPATGDSQPLTTTEGQPTGDPAAQPPASPFGGGFLLVLMGMLVLMFFMSWRTQNKEKKRRATMLAALKKGDRVQTVGGVLGSVVEVRENDVLVKVDENANARIRFTRGAIQSVVEDTPA